MGYRGKIRRITAVVVVVTLTLSTCVTGDESSENPGSSGLEKRDNKMDASEFEVLVQLRGKAYQKKRDDMLNEPEKLQAFLATYDATSDWRHRVTKEVLNGWLQHRDLYVKVLNELDAVNAKAEGRTAVGISRIWDAYALKASEEYKEDILPLSWEVVLKFSEEWPEWKVITYLSMIGAVPTDTSIEPVVSLLQETRQKQLMDVSGRTLAMLPSESVRVRVSQMQTRHAKIQDILADTIDELDDID